MKPNPLHSFLHTKDTTRRHHLYNYIMYYIIVILQEELRTKDQLLRKHAQENDSLMFRNQQVIIHSSSHVLYK